MTLIPRSSPALFELVEVWALDRTETGPPAKGRRPENPPGQVLPKRATPLEIDFS